MGLRTSCANFGLEYSWDTKLHQSRIRDSLLFPLQQIYVFEVLHMLKGACAQLLQQQRITCLRSKRMNSYFLAQPMIEWIAAQ
jgi:hypothetical protein